MAKQGDPGARPCGGTNVDGSACGNWTLSRTGMCGLHHNAPSAGTATPPGAITSLKAQADYAAMVAANTDAMFAEAGDTGTAVMCPSGNEMHGEWASAGIDEDTGLQQWAYVGVLAADCDPVEHEEGRLSVSVGQRLAVIMALGDKPDISEIVERLGL